MPCHACLAFFAHSVIFIVLGVSVDWSRAVNRRAGFVHECELVRFALHSQYTQYTQYTCLVHVSE